MAGELGGGAGWASGYSISNRLSGIREARPSTGRPPLPDMLSALIDGAERLIRTIDEELMAMDDGGTSVKRKALRSVQQQAQKQIESWTQERDHTRASGGKDRTS